MITSISGARVAQTRLAAIELYDEAPASCRVDLSDNTNLWGTPPAAAAVLRDTRAPAISRYPSAYASELKQFLARYLGVEPEMVVTGCGSDDVLDSAVRAFAGNGDRLVHANPTFGMIPVFARLNGVEPVAVDYDADGDIDPQSFVASNARLAYVCTPNNPTGLSVDPAKMEILATGFPGVVIVDRAYAEFSSIAFPPLHTTCRNVLVTGTFSKAFGLAGLRVGYATGAASLVREVEKSRGPYKVNVIAARAAVAALENDLPWIAARISDMKANRSRFVSVVERAGLRGGSSDANFVLIPVADALAVSARMRSRGIAVRSFSNLRGIGDALRITVGPWPLMEECADALLRSLS